MILITAFFLQIVFTLPLFLRLLRRRAAGAPSDLLEPSALVSLLHMLTVVPYLVLLHFDPDIVHPAIQNSLRGQSLESAVLWYGVVQALAFVALQVGISVPLPWVARMRALRLNTVPNDWRAGLAVVTCFGLGILGYALFLRGTGGYEEFASNMGDRQSQTRGAGYILSLMMGLLFSTCIAVYSFRYGWSRSKILFAAVIFVGAYVAYTSFGGRKLGIHLILYAALTWHYGVRRIVKVPWKGVALAALLIPWFVALPLFRVEGATTLYRNNPDQLRKDVVENLDLVVRQLSYSETYIFITNYVQPGDIWWGQSYLDLLLMPIPRNLMENKPPGDDGIYIRNLADGRQVRPGTAQSEMIEVSWPPETLGVGYLNFWVPGVIFGMLFLGMIYRAAYVYMESCQYGLHSIVCYATILLNFHLSNLRIAQCLITIALATALFAVLLGLPLRSNRARRFIPHAGEATSA